MYRTAELGGQFLLLGSGHADGDFRAMAAQDFKDSPDVRLMVRSIQWCSSLLFVLFLSFLPYAMAASSARTETVLTHILLKYHEIPWSCDVSHIIEEYT